MESLLALCLQRMEADGMEAFEEILAAHPDLAPGLRQNVDRMLAAGLVKPRRRGAAPLEDRLGEFRLLERIGVGGMGIVYRAEQESLGRLVALKLIRPDYLHVPGARERLRREVESVARLDHPGIVSILTVGEDKDVPYFAMEFIKGASMAELIERLAARPAGGLGGAELYKELLQASGEESDTRANNLPALFRGSWWQVCVRIARQVAEALAHAHERGIIHRDVKPSNIMLTPGGRVLVVDFGLAQSSEGAKITRSGAMLGSLAYMSPEQVRGQAQDQRVDVYGLGVSLYEMLCLRLPFAATEVLALQGEVLEGRHSPPRLHYPGLPRDLETVLLTALRPEPGGRYTGAQDLAEELTNVLEWRPVRARRPGVLIRCLRWAQRHRGAAAALACALLLVTGLPLGLWFKEREASGEIAAALRDAERHFLRSLDAVDAMLREVAHQRLREVPQMAPVRIQLLRDALRFYADLIAERPGIRLLKLRAARVGTRLAEYLSLAGHPSEEILAEYDRALGYWEQVYDEVPQVGPEMWEALIFAAGVRADHIDLDGSEKSRHSAEMLRELDVRIQAMARRRLPEADPEEVPVIRYVRLVSRRQAVCAGYFGGLVQGGELNAALEELAAGFRELSRTRVRDRACLAVGETELRRGIHLEGQGQYREAIKVYTACRPWLDREFPRAYSPVQHKFVLAQADNGVARCQGHLGRNERAVAAAERAAAICRQGRDHLPEFPGWYREEALALYQLGVSQFNLHQTDAARQTMAASVRAGRAYLERRPGTAEAGRILFMLHEQAAVIAAVQCEHSLLRGHVVAMVEYRDDPASLLRGAVFMATCGMLTRKDHSLSEVGRQESAARDFARAVDYLRQAVAGGLADPAVFDRPAFAELQGRADFEALRAGMRAGAQRTQAGGLR